MKRHVRFLVIVVTGFVALIGAGSAFAAISPTLTVGTTNLVGGPNVIISGGVSNPAEDAFAKIQIYVPQAFGLVSPVGGATVGSVTGRALFKDLDPTSEATFTGTVVAIATTDPAVAYENANCDGVSHQGAWMMRLTSVHGQANIPIFVDKTSGTETQLGAYKLVMCLRSPDLPQGDANRSTLGTKLNSFQLTLTGFKVPRATGSYRWRSLWTPYTPGTATVNTTGSVEAQSTVRIPSGVLTLSSKKVKVQVKGGGSRIQVRLTGRLVIGGERAAAYPVAMTHGGTKSHLVPLGSVKTNAAGQYLILSALKKPTYFQAGATITRQDLGPGGCIASFGTSVPCVNASIGGSRVLSRLNYARP